MKKGFTLIEMMVVLMIFIFLLAAILGVLTLSDRSWQIGQRKLTTQQEARKVMDNIAGLLRQTNSDWIIGGNHYALSISGIGNNRIDFYQPIFNSDGIITNLPKVTFKLDPANPRRLLRNIGSTVNPSIISEEIQSITFGGGCPGCLPPYVCTSVAVDCPIVQIQITTSNRDQWFTLSSQVMLRNRNITATGTIEEPEEGAF
jgi:prepilin-type N-terminal cleavage/methylation domain-containing protein